MENRQLSYVSLSVSYPRDRDASFLLHFLSVSLFLSLSCALRGSVGMWSWLLGIEKDESHVLQDGYQTNCPDKGWEWGLGVSCWVPGMLPTLPRHMVLIVCFPTL